MAQEGLHSVGSEHEHLSKGTRAGIGRSPWSHYNRATGSGAASPCPSCRTSCRRGRATVARSIRGGMGHDGGPRSALRLHLHQPGLDRLRGGHRLPPPLDNAVESTGGRASSSRSSPPASRSTTSSGCSGSPTTSKCRDTRTTTCRRSGCTRSPRPVRGGSGSGKTHESPHRHRSARRAHGGPVSRGGPTWTVGVIHRHDDAGIVGVSRSRRDPGSGGREEGALASKATLR